MNFKKMRKEKKMKAYKQEKISLTVKKGQSNPRKKKQNNANPILF